MTQEDSTKVDVTINNSDRFAWYIQ